MLVLYVGGERGLLVAAVEEERRSSPLHSDRQKEKLLWWGVQNYCAKKEMAAFPICFPSSLLLILQTKLPRQTPQAWGQFALRLNAPDLIL